MVGDRLIMLPGEPGFNEILATPPPDPTNQQTFICRAGSDVLEAVDQSDALEYLIGGEYQERLEQIESDILYLPETYELT